MKNADVLRLAAERIDTGTAFWPRGIKTRHSCQAVWGALDLNGRPPFDTPLTDVYGDLFAPNAARGLPAAYWLSREYSGLSDEEAKEFRVTALLLYAAMIEAGDA